MSDKVEKPEPFGRGHNKGEDDKKFQDLKPSQFDKCVRAALNRWIFSRDCLKGEAFRPPLLGPQFIPGVSSPESGERGEANGVKSLDANRYATKKTIAQGMLDIALLTANASQLKYILQVGKQHEFYTLMLTLICVSIGLQAIVGLLFIAVGGLDINRRRDQWAANIINDVILIGVFVISLTNVAISGFGMEFSNKPREVLTGANYAVRRGIAVPLE
ncbi:ninjurin-2 isoform X2 [Diachasma alloeum]|uniref:ninjurin-2 isoform X2 n=1 Tax=Diachasma alloeum TaxID=454923 RepID=UPI0007383856|nr:ninjurin-2 isoform X2 [Diachasma alloeum]